MPRFTGKSFSGGTYDNRRAFPSHLQSYRAVISSRRLSAELKAEAIIVFHQSRKSVSGFAREIEVAPATFKKWLEENPDSTPGNFHKIIVHSTLPTASALVLHGPHGIRIKGLQIVQLTEPIGQLEGM